MVGVVREKRNVGVFEKVRSETAKGVRAVNLAGEWLNEDVSVRLNRPDEILAGERNGRMEATVDGWMDGI